MRLSHTLNYSGLPNYFNEITYLGLADLTYWAAGQDSTPIRFGLVYESRRTLSL